MKRGTKIGWLMIACSIILSIWVIAGQSSKATEDETKELNATVEQTDVETTETSTETAATGEDVLSGENDSLGEAENSETETENTENQDAVGTETQETDLTEDAPAAGAPVAAKAMAPMAADAADGLTLSDDGTAILAYSGTGASVTIPSTVTSGATAGTFNSSNLQNIYVDSGNPTYASYDGALYNASLTTLIKVPNGKTSVNLATTTTTIGEGAFSGSPIYEITIPDSVTSIGAQSGWKVNTIYCSQGSAANLYANANSINAVFPGADDPEPEEPDEPDTPVNPGTNSGANTNGNNTNGKGTNTNGNASNKNSSKPAPNTTNVTIINQQPANPAPQQNTTNASTKGGSSGRSGGHTQDATPKTADGDIDPRLILCFATLAAGIGILLYSRSKSKVIVAAEKSHGLDD